MRHTQPAAMTPALYDEANARRYYTWRAGNYDALTDYETEHHLEAVRLASIREGEHVLEVACGTGRATVELAKAVGPAGRLAALDLTEAMLERARGKIEHAGHQDRVEFRSGNAKQLPYPDESFDVVYNAYMFDLIPEEDFPVILGEFKRVLKPGGRLILVNLSKPGPERIFYEWLYDRGWVGACRPVLMSGLAEQAGFAGVQRIYRKNHGLYASLYGTEIVTGSK